jgi:hypothetical protein
MRWRALQTGREFESRRSGFQAGHTLLREPLDGAGNRISGDPSAVGHRSVTCGGFRRLRCSFQLRLELAPLARFASQHMSDLQRIRERQPVALTNALESGWRQDPKSINATDYCPGSIFSTAPKVSSVIA